MRIPMVALAVSAVLAMGCGHELALTPEGTRVQHVERPRLPDHCRVVGDVLIGIPPDASVARTEQELAILMRNKAADMGADHVVVERSDSQPAADGTARFTGAGTAYVCSVITGGGEDPPEAPAEAPATTP